MERIARNAAELVGRTPLVRLAKIGKNLDAEIVAKLEFFNPCASVKDRIGVSMIRAAMKAGQINDDTVLIEATSGNTGIGLAFAAAAWGLKIAVVMPDSMSLERRAILKLLGAELILTPGEKGMPGAVEEMNRLVASDSRYLPMKQFDNPANPEIHRVTTAMEIWDDCDGRVDALVCGVGSAGTITGAGEKLKELSPSLQVVAVEPAASPVLSGGKPGPHKIQGIGAGFVPGVLNLTVIDRVEKVSNEDAFAMTESLAREEGILAGYSAGAAVHAACIVAGEANFAGKRIVVIVPDSAERYLGDWIAKETP